jgi:streptogramin lyase
VAIAIVSSGCEKDPRAVELIDTQSAPQVVATAGDSVFVGTSDEVLRLNRDGEVQDSTSVWPSPAGIAIGDGAVWITSSEDGSVTRIDPRTMSVTAARLDLGVSESSLGIPIAVGEGSAWLAVDDAIRRIDARTGRTRGRPIEVGGSPRALAIAGGDLWVLIGVGTKRVKRTSVFPPERGSVLPKSLDLESEPSRDHTIVRIDAHMGRVRPGRLRTVADARDMAFGLGRLWITGHAGVVSLDPRTGRQTGRAIPVGGPPNEVAVDGRSVWATRARVNSVYEIDPRARRVVRGPIVVPSETEGVSGEVGDLAAGAGAVWVGNPVASKLARIEP